MTQISRTPGFRSDAGDYAVPAIAARAPETLPGEIGDLVEHFYGVAARRPHGIALEAFDRCLTYAELDAITNRLAHRLRSLGVDRESRVGISLNRGAAELIAFLATAKAGGAYVPLDPSHPPDRLNIVLEDAEPQVLITSSESALLSGPDRSERVLLIDDIEQATQGFDSSRPQVDYVEGQIAYVLFTSGSTGRPKGVEISRGAFANFLGSMAHTPGMSEGERLMAITTTSFDIAGLELFLPLWVGATVVIVDRDTARDPRKLARRLEQGDISVLQATPATWRPLLEAGWHGSPELRMLCGGEAISPVLAKRLLGCGRELWNLYGPTETTVWSSIEQIHPGFDRITVGRPIDRTQMYILDETLQPAPEGEEGEIWIGGAGLARGYLGRPDLTAERFVQNPRGPVGDRIYRTGDLGRQLEDGRIECLGRLDHQVKIRGHRIELAEIESVLRHVPDVGEALVTADQRSSGDPRLVAYWVGEARREALIEEARRKLPSYMVPVAYVHLEAFPLNTNGKIDRNHLPPPELLSLDGVSPKRPRNDVETRIASIWSQVLGVTEVSIDQDFFTYGGTSALAVEVVARLERETGIEVPLRALFEAPTVEGLARRLGESFPPDEPIVVWLRRGRPEKPPLWCLFGVTIYQDLALALTEDRSVVGVHVPFRYVPGVDRHPSIGEIAGRYVELIRRHQPSGPYHLLGLCLGGIVAYEVARQLEAAGEQIARVVVLDALLPTAIRKDRLRQVHSHVRRALREPEEFGRWLLRRGRRALDRIGKLRPPGGRQTTEPVDLAVDGPEADAAVEEFALRTARIRCALLIVRAMCEPIPSSWHVEPDMGWKSFADRVIVHEMAAGHLQVLREPHVRSLARAITAQMEPPTLLSVP